jgi:hypothetical protein
VSRPLTEDRAEALARALSGRRSLDAARGAVRVRVAAGRIVFEFVPLVRNRELGGLWMGAEVLSAHSLDLRATDEARAVAHFEGFCENHGLGVAEGDTVSICCGSSSTGTRSARVVSVGPRRLRVRGSYGHGGPFERSVPKGDAWTLRRFVRSAS